VRCVVTPALLTLSFPKNNIPFLVVVIPKARPLMSSLYFLSPGLRVRYLLLMAISLICVAWTGLAILAPLADFF